MAMCGIHCGRRQLGKFCFPRVTDSFRQQGLREARTTPRLLELQLSAGKHNLVCAEQRIDFKDFKCAFSNRATWKLIRSYVILQLCATNSIARNSLMLMVVARKLMGKRLFERCMKLTIYGQFVAGDDETSVKGSIKELHACGVRVIVACTSEKEENSAFRKERGYDDQVAQCIRIAELAEPEHPMAQMKMTGTVPADILVELSKINQKHVRPLMEALSDRLSGSEERTHGVWLADDMLQLDDNGRRKLGQAVAHLKSIGQVALTKGVALLVDAEYSSVNPAITIFALAMMKAFNKEKPIIWNTYQCYLKNSYDSVKRDVELAHRFGVCFGAKLVRGAYLHHEREMARKNGNWDPVNGTFQETSLMYQRVSDYLLQFGHDNPGRCSLMIATHNEDTIQHVIQKMLQLDFKNDDKTVCFGQLLGMSDHISYLLGINGYNVYKSSPFGDVETVLPYLYRRAMENQSVLQGSRNEVSLLWLEMRNRINRIMSWRTR